MYSWFGKFQVDQQSNKVIPLSIENLHQISKFREIFALNLEANKNLFNWEITLFYLCINNIFSKDELVFALNIRNYAFSGPELERNNFDKIPKIKIELLHQIINNFLFFLTDIERETLFKNLIENLKKSSEISHPLDLFKVEINIIYLCLQYYSGNINRNYLMKHQKLLMNY